MRSWRAALSLLIAAALVPASPACAAGPPLARRGVPRVGVLLPGPRPPDSSPVVEALRELGWAEGRTIRFESRYADWRPERLAGLALELVRLDVDVILATNLQAAQAAKRATATIPIVMLAGADPVARGLVAAPDRPGGNVTGVRLTTADVVGRQVEVLKQLKPVLTRLAVLWDGALGRFDPSREAQLQSGVAGVQLVPVEVRGPIDFERALASAVAADAGAVTLVEGPMFLTHRRRLAEAALRRRLPAVAMSPEFAEAGFLLASGPNEAEIWRRVARLVDRILKGARPATLPLERPERYDLIVNLKTAAALGLVAPPELLARAEVISP
jgi:putative tryptophan/tyrosine transport system substrate-binding protein